MKDDEWLDERFDALRSHLDSDRTRENWGGRLLDLCKQAHTLNPRTYEDTWKPYLSDVSKTLPKPLTTIRLAVRKVAVEELEEAVALLPEAWFKLTFYNAWLGDDGLKAFAESSAFSRVCALQFDRTRIYEKTLVPLYALSHFTSLSIRDGNINAATLRQLAQSPLSTQLTELWLGDSVHDEGVEALLGASLFANLTSLGLNEVILREPGLKLLVNSKLMGQLTELDLSRNDWLKDAAAIEIAKNPASRGLTVLRLRGVRLSVEGIRALSLSPYLQGLTTLDLGGNDLDGESIAALATSEAFPALRNLSLGSNPLRPSDAASLVSGPFLANVTSLDLSYTSIGDQGVSTLAASPHISKLSKLLLSTSSGPRIGASGAQAIADSPHLSSLTRLDLHGANIGNEGFAALVTSPNLPKLAHLSLYKNGIGPEGLRALTQTPSESPIESLVLTDNPIRDEGAVILFEKAGLSKLHTLTIAGARIGDIGAKSLATSRAVPRLDAITLRCNRISDEGAMAIVESPLLTNRLVALGLSGHDFTPETYMAYGHSALFGNLSTFDLWDGYSKAMLRELIAAPEISSWLRKRWSYILALQS